MKNLEKSPNVVVLLTTQWRAQSTGYSGDGNAVTPNLDALAERSIDFYQAVTPHPFGVFARGAFLTGVACPENGIADYYDPLPSTARTIAHRYREKGYETAFFGKWQLYERDRKAPVVGEDHAKIEVPANRRGGFSFWEGFESGFLLNNGFYHGSSLGPPRRIEGYQSEVVVGRFEEFLEEKASGQPLFAFLSLDPPHPPYAEPASDVPPSDPNSILLPEEVDSDPEIVETARRELSGYYAHIEATDRAVGRLVASLKRSLDWENTIFVFSSVHGDMHGSHGLFRKGWPHEESVRVPLLMSWPAVFKTARRDPLLISLLDLGPSLYGLCFEGEGWGADVNSRGLDLSAAIRLQAVGPDFQRISMPSVPPFAKQCSYAWQAKRSAFSTEVVKQDGESFTLDH